MSIQFLIGCDPEFFLKDKSTGKFVSAYGMIPGTKHDPLPLEGGAAQVDGMALEININPASSFKEFDSNITKVLAQVRELIPSEYEFSFQPVAKFGKKYIKSQPDEAKMLGCDPDYDAYTGAINPKPNADLGFRTASGHIHIGWTEAQDISHPEHIEACHMLTKQLDCYLGIPSLLWDTDDIRRKMYGQFGAFRPKHYGVEYRVLSNIWLGNVKWREYVYNQTVFAANKLLDGARIYESLNARRIYNCYSYNDISSVIQSYVYHNNINDFEKIHHRMMDLKYDGRAISLENNKLYKSGEYFRDAKTGTLIHYDLVSYEDIQSGAVEYSSSKIKQHKKANLTWAQVSPKENSPISVEINTTNLLSLEDYEDIYPWSVPNIANN